MKRQHTTELEIANRLLYGCHICGTGEPTWSYARYSIYGYFPCRECYNQHRYWEDHDESSLFYHLAAPYMDSVGGNYFEFLHDKFCREQFRKARNEKGIYEPTAYCDGCKKVLPLFDMQRYGGKLKIVNGVLHGGFRCFECRFYERHVKRTCFYCHREIYLPRNEFRSDFFQFYRCTSCENIHTFDRKIRDRRDAERRALQAIESLRHYVKRLLVNAGTEDPDEEMIDIKLAQLTMKRTLKQFNQWRKENESNHTDVSGKQRADETDYEGRL